MFGYFKVDAPPLYFRAREHRIPLTDLREVDPALASFVEREQVLAGTGIATLDVDLTALAEVSPGLSHRGSRCLLPEVEKEW